MLSHFCKITLPDGRKIKTVFNDNEELYHMRDGLTIAKAVKLGAIVEVYAMGEDKTVDFLNIAMRFELVSGIPTATKY